VPKLIAFCYAMFCLAVIPTGSVAAAGSVVDTPASLMKALRSAAPGAVIELAPGDYGTLSLRGFDRGGKVTLRSAEAQNPAHFSKMVLNDVQGLTLEQVVFDYVFEPDDVLQLRPFQIVNSAHITIRSALFDGDLARGRSAADDGFPTAFGLGVRGSTHITLRDNEIRGFFRGTVISQTDHIIVQGNDLHSIRMDGMNFAEVKDVRIQGNHIHDFDRSLESKDHADMIQFWTNRTSSPSRDIVIRDNILNSGDGWFTQSIFMRNDMVDRGLAGPEMFYKNIQIENNLIINAHLHGITVGETQGLTIRNNTVVRNSRSEGALENPGLWIPQIRVAEMSRDVEISRNVTHRIVGAQAQESWRVGENFFVQDKARMAAGFYGIVFGRDVLGNPTTVHAFMPHPDGPLAGVNAGVQGLIQ